jgi:hypothetical protein
MSDVVYATRAVDFLKRAKGQLDSGIPEALFYAALEVRFGVEARLQAYTATARKLQLEAYDGWEIAKLAKGIGKAFRGNADAVARLSCLGPAKETVLTLEFTPVPPELSTLACRLGDYLRFQEKRLPLTSNWWSEFRRSVARSVELLSVSARGELLGPPMWRPSTGEINLHFEMHAQDPRIATWDTLSKTGEIRAFSLERIPFSKAVDDEG